MRPFDFTNATHYATAKEDSTACVTAVEISSRHERNDSSQQKMTLQNVSTSDLNCETAVKSVAAKNLRDE